MPTLLAGVFIAVLCVGAMFHMQRSLREAREWVTECANINDPWVRFEKLALKPRPNLDAEQEVWRKQQSTEALISALATDVSAAQDFVERWEGTYAELVDKYPRDPEQRKLQLDALRVVWPNILALPTVDRVVLVHMARACHLQDAEPPVSSETVLGCLHYGAKTLNAEKELGHLLDSARLHRPLTAAP